MSLMSKKRKSQQRGPQKENKRAKKARVATAAAAKELAKEVRAQAAQGRARDARVDDIFRVSRRCEECEECFKPERRHFDAFLQNSPQLLDHQLQDDAFCSAAAAFSTLVGPPVRKVTVLAGNQIRLRDASLVRESSLLVAVDHVLEHALGRTGLLDSNHPKQNGKNPGCGPA